ncbi:hypothetical protein BPAE_0406g00040 [Botrytis paeoniae]|uniref:Uncharacterized protein n=1 Tax=Botrytis paeoniae TaxID=278948 RepID=A0A4Z1F0E8_9HELO|nr:hypothetical protein BPAE_0406g00040 [Botrytis paeoniae]
MLCFVDLPGYCPRLVGTRTHKVIAAGYVYCDLRGAEPFALDDPGNTSKSIPIQSNLSLMEPASAQAIGKDLDLNYERPHRQVPEYPRYENIYACPCNCPQLYQNRTPLPTSRSSLPVKTYQTVKDSAVERRTTTALIQETNDIAKPFNPHAVLEAL